VKVDIGDIELFFDVDGVQLVISGPRMRQRPTVVLLHTGPGADHSFYKDHLGPALARDMQVVYLDNRGAGRSDRSTPDRWTLDTWTEDVQRFCDALEIVRPVLVGTAFGAFVAMRYAARHPNGLSKLVLTSAVARYSQTRSINVFDRLGGPAAGETAARYFADPNEVTLADFMRVCLPLYTREPLSPEALARIPINFELSAHWDAGEARTFDLRGELGQIRVPTLVLAGDDDPSTTIEGTRELVELLPRGLVRFEHYPDARHGVFRDAPEAVEVVREFVLEEV
jgi:pimeloyl-ACP methyl ester carboxylesterase